ncbi:hypothetical protein [uncultured Bacteroides sp.]|uniref:hypothetical protein n=1 Tax=uncultured Bacteroides sp. TaxID=162156 RepID=UPI0025EF04D8|nr:hypothetical protein [uncultured Bacteroides sp.]
MKAIIVCISPSADKLNETISFIDKSKVKVYKDEVILCLKFDRKNEANIYAAFDLIKPQYLENCDVKLISSGKKNEFKVNGVFFSIRVGDERTSFISFFDSCKNI